MVLFLLSIQINGCQNRNAQSYQDFVLDKGAVHFSLEYRTYYKIKEIKPGDNTGNFVKDLTAVTFISPRIKRTGDHTYIKVLVAGPTELVPDAKAGIERAERNAASWPDYKLLDKHELTIDGVNAYRIDYQNRNVIPAIAGVSNEPFVEVCREVNFDANGYNWMIQMRSDSSTAEADKADFEHIIQSFNILD
jgi:hypothetical protein